MATPSTSSDASSPSSTKKYNLRNPLPLSATQEQEVKQLYYKRVRGYCAAEIKGMCFLRDVSNCLAHSLNMAQWPNDTQLLENLTLPKDQTKANLANILTTTAFAECAVNRTVTATWVCRQQRLAMNSCMIEHAKPEEQDRAREEWFATYGERRRAKEEEAIRVEQRREEVIRMMREDEERRRQEKAAR